METQISSGSIEVRVRSLPTEFGGRHSKLGFIPDTDFVALKLTPEQYAEIRGNKDFITHLGTAPDSLAATEAAIREAAEMLAAEKRAHQETKQALEKAVNAHAAEVVNHGRTRGELDALKQVALGGQKVKAK